MSKYVDVTSITQVVGCVFNNPNILDQTDKYKITTFFNKNVKPLKML